MKKIAPIILLALCLLLGCKASLSTKVDDQCKSCKELISKGICGDSVKKTTTSNDSIAKADSVKKYQSLNANKTVVNSALNVYDVCDEWKKKYESLMTREDRETFDFKFTEAKAIHSSNIDRNCPDVPKYSKVEMDHYYSESGVKDGKFYHNMYKKEHKVTIATTTIQEPVLFKECSPWGHWYFYGFLIESALIIFFVLVAVLSILKLRK